MATSAQRREQLESHLQQFREIADQRMHEKIVQWSSYLPAMVSATILICQIANTVIFATFAYNFGALYVMLDAYMTETDAMNVTFPNTTTQFRYTGIHVDRIQQIDEYHDKLWTLFIAEVIELLFPAINLFMFAWIIKDKRRHFSAKVQAIYLLCPALALILSITQALNIHVTISESIYTIRFMLAKIMNTLLELNRAGRFPIEQYFDCEFFNDDDIVKPSCVGQIHDTVLSKSTLTVVITIHVIPVVICVYLLIRNLKSHKLEHLFLYIESVPPQQQNLGGQIDTNLEKGDGAERKNANGTLNEPRSLKETLNDLLNGFNVKFVPKKVFCDSMAKRRGSTTTAGGSSSASSTADAVTTRISERRRSMPAVTVENYDEENEKKNEKRRQETSF